jgi:ribosome biogenesis GTPase A
VSVPTPYDKFSKKIDAKYVVAAVSEVLKVAEKYAIEESLDGFENLQGIAKSRHCLLRGNELDLEKASRMMLDDFRNGRIGRITLEYPGDFA